MDPYYLTAKAESVGYHPQVILAGRRINNGMGKFVAEQTMKLLSQLDRPVNDLKVAVLGLTFKENVPDLRNSKVPDIIQELREYGVQVLVHDPIAESEEAVDEYGIHLQQWNDLKRRRWVGYCSSAPSICGNGFAGITQASPQSAGGCGY